MTSTDLAAWAAKLDAFTPDQIRDFLRDEGITGRRRDPIRCPVATLLAQRTGQPWIAVSSCGIEASNEVVALPDSVRDFVEVFDSGGYPEVALAQDQRPSWRELP